MSEYENKTNEELIDLLEERDESLQDAESSLSDLSDQITELSIDNSMLEDFRENKEELVESSFNSGYEAKENNEPKLKAWLNHKIGARI